MVLTLYVGVAGYFYARELRELQDPDAEQAIAEGATPVWHMRSIFTVLYHIFVFNICLTKAAIQGRLHRLDKANGSDQKYPEMRPLVSFVDELPEM